MKRVRRRGRKHFKCCLKIAVLVITFSFDLGFFLLEEGDSGEIQGIDFNEKPYNNSHSKIKSPRDYLSGKPCMPVERVKEWPPIYDRNKRIAVIIPYRDRREHLKTWLSHFNQYVEIERNNSRTHDYFVTISEHGASDMEPFRKGWVTNCALASLNQLSFYDCIVECDVDMLPIAMSADFTWCEWPSQPFRMQKTVMWGGGISMSPKHWRETNGFSNEFIGWGREDKDLIDRAALAGLWRGYLWPGEMTEKCANFIRRPPLGAGKHKRLGNSVGKGLYSKYKDHTVRDKTNFALNVRLNQRTLRGKHNFRTDGLNNAFFEMVKNHDFNEFSRRFPDHSITHLNFQFGWQVFRSANSSYATYDEAVEK